MALDLDEDDELDDTVCTKGTAGDNGVMGAVACVNLLLSVIQAAFEGLDLLDGGTNKLFPTGGVHLEERFWIEDGRLRKERQEWSSLSPRRLCSLDTERCSVMVLIPTTLLELSIY